MGRRDTGRSGLLTCLEVRDRLYPYLLRTVGGPEREAIALHVETCESCRLLLRAAHGRLGAIAGLPVADPSEARRARVRRRRRALLVVLAVLPGALAFGLLLENGIQIARFRGELRAFHRLETAILAWREDFGHYPPVGPAALVVQLRTRERRGPYLELAELRLDGAGRPLDRWGNPYVYRAPGLRNPTLFDLQSFGPNGRDDDGRGDDLANW